MKLATFLIMLTLTPLGYALGGDERANITHTGFSPVSADKACGVAAKRLKENVGIMGWTILSKGNVPCNCETVKGGWSCSISALVSKPEDESSVD